MSGPGGWLLRRLVVIPFVGVLLLFLAASWVVVLVVSAIASPVRGLVIGKRPRWRVLRITSLAVLYALGEVLTVLLCLGLWLASGLGWRLRHPRFVSAHVRLLGAFLGALVRLSRPLFGFRLDVSESRRPADLLLAETTEPLLVLARHAGPGASFALLHLLVHRYHRHPVVVLKELLRLDPAIDLLLTRIGCTWIPARREGVAATARVGAAAAALGPRQALVLFPEGADWTPLRHLRAVARLRRRGLLNEAQRALQMPHVLPPRPAGTWAALQAAPAADVLVFTHTGHDELLDMAAAWRALPLREPLHMAWWRAESHEVPRASEEEVQSWLQETWADIDAWVGEQQALDDLVT